MGTGFTPHCEQDKDFCLKLQQGIFSIEEVVSIMGRGVEYIVWDYNLHCLETASNRLLVSTVLCALLGEDELTVP